MGGLSQNNILWRFNMEILDLKNIRLFTIFDTNFLDCETLSSNEKILLIILMRYRGYRRNHPQTIFPSYTELAKKTGLARSVLIKTLKLLEAKQLIIKQTRYCNDSRARATNFYIIRDNPLFWESSPLDSNDIDTFDVTIKMAIKESINLLQIAGYKVIKPAKENKLIFTDNNVNSATIKKIKPYTIIYNDFLDFEGLHSKEKLILVLLMRYGATCKNNANFPTTRTLARKTGMSERSVQYILKKLIEKNLLIRQTRFSKSKQQISNAYIIDDNPNLWKNKDSNHPN